MRKWIYWPDNASGRVRTRTFIVSWIIYSRPCTRPALSHSPPFQRLLLLPHRFVRGVFLETRSFHLRPQMRPACATIYSPIMRIHRPKGQQRLYIYPNDKRIRKDSALSVTSFPFFANDSTIEFSSNESFYRFTARLYIEIPNVWLTSNKGIIMSTIYIYAKECTMK